ncbi:MAG: hypothetical protein ACON5H_10165 [Akkermansiaceae bacterium]
MDKRERAEENLAVIRSMMERATVYRMISGPTALFAGLLTLAMVIFFPWDDVEDKYDWKWIWFAVAGITLLFNTALVVQKAKREGAAIFSPGLKMGFRAILPAMIIGFVIGLMQFRAYDHVVLAWIWMLCYGAALTATGSFAPRSMWWLGIIFIGTGLCFFRSYPSGLESVVKGNLMMAQTFGAYHLVYGLYVLLIEQKRD